LGIFPPACTRLAQGLLTQAMRTGVRLATAESCTGGLIAGCLTEIAGSSAVVDRGYVVYDNRAKVEMLGVREATLEAHGAVSEETACEMVRGAVARSGCDLAIAVTGIAGPGGGSAAKPVGLVHIAAGRRGGSVLHQRHVFAGNRSAIRLATVEAALSLALAALELVEDAP
jgi:nicotinamide-nucleotide amidase